MMPSMADTKRVAGGPPHDGLAIVTADQDTVRGDGASDRPLRADRRSITGVIDVRDYGAVGDGVADDLDPILAAVADAAVLAHGGAFGAFVYFPKGIYQVSARVPIPNGVGLRGDGPSASAILASPAFHDTCLVGNEDPSGGQEFAFLTDLSIDGNQQGGAVVTVAAVDFVSVFITTFVDDVIVRNSSAVGLRFAARHGLGPVRVTNTWVLNSVGHNVLIEEEAGNTDGVFGICADGLWSENSGPGTSAIYLKGRGRAAQWSFRNVHIEQGTAAAGRTGITVDGVPLVLVDGAQILQGATPLGAGIRITNVPDNTGIQIRGVINPNLANPILEDLFSLVTYGARNIDYYVSAGVVLQGATLIGSGDRAGPPGTGEHFAGEVVFVANPVAGGFAGWVCVTGGVSGTWKSFGAIST